MADFLTSQKQLAAARAARDAAETALSEARETLQQARAKLAAYLRQASQGDAASQQKTQLEAAVTAAAAAVSRQKEVLQSTNLAAQAALEGFASFTDPRQNASQLNAATPFLLLPVRVETRFVTVNQTHQLWVRIYPDDCSIDTFEPQMSETELANAKLYWERMWAAGGVEADQRGAWRGLVSAHGSGRASWILDNYQPLNLSAQPIKAVSTDEILVIPTGTTLAAGDSAAITSYWQAIWLADGDATQSNAAHAALASAVGAARAAELIAGYMPFNLADTPAKPLKKSDVGLSTQFVVFPPDPAVKQAPWSQAPRVNHLADRFVVLGFQAGSPPLQAIGGVVSLPLYTGPDPSADPSETIHAQGADLVVPDQLQWLVDFDRAVAAGMGLRINLTPAQAAQGFDRLLVIGLQLSANQAMATQAIEELLVHHHYGRSGLSLVPQGTPTHNSTGASAGAPPLDDPDATFDDRKHFPLFTPAPDPLDRLDGDWLTRLLGIDPSFFQKVHGSDGKDQMQARAMQTALWPATLGYWMDKMLTPVFSDETVANTHAFFTSYVSGRGAIPALRIGGQPYGILPTTAFSRIAWFQGDNTRIVPQLRFLQALASVLSAIGKDWSNMSANAAFVGKAGDAHQLLLDILALHPASVEFHTRYAESVAELFNTVNLWGLGPDFWQAILTLALESSGDGLLSKLGYHGTQSPDILKHLFLKDAAQVANVIDDRPLSETAPIRAYTDDGRNYIQWLIDAANTSLDAVYQENGFTGNRTPETLLYLYLRHALTLGYYDSSYNLHRSAGFLSPAQLAAFKPEPIFVHVADAPASESRFAALYKTEPRITSSSSLLVSDYITAHLATLVESQDLAGQIRALGILKTASTAVLERAFAEHIDCCSYRYDAWLLGLVRYRLEQIRASSPAEQNQGNTALYLGAYAWLEELRPSPAKLQPVQLPPEVAPNFLDKTPILHDPANGGYIHAPSLHHAETAAVLRSGYQANATPANPSTLSVNLSSDRVRLAMSMLEGIRNGQSFGALLGYQFERGLHDDYGLAEVDQFIYPLRKVFPLVADAIATTKTDPGVPIESIEARNVLDGMKLVTQIRTGGEASYPFGQSLPPASSDQAAAINAQANLLLDIYDAIADLALAEGVHQAVQGNFARIGATLDAYTTGHFPPDPEVVQTPADGIALTLRTAIHFQPGLPAPADTTPRSTVEPALDSWLATMIPPLGTIGCLVTWTDPATSAAQQQPVTMAHLAVRPIDLLNLIKPDDVQSMNELDDRVLRFVILNRLPRPDSVLKIEYMKSGGASLSVFETLPLLRCLRAIVGHTRPLRATDVLLHNDASPEDDAAVFIDATRISLPRADLDILSGDIVTFLATLEPLLSDPVANRTALIFGIDGFVTKAVELLERASRFAIPSAGWGFGYQWQKDAWTSLITQTKDLIDRWSNRLTDYDAKIAAYDTLPATTTGDVLFRALRAAEAEITTAVSPLPATPAMYRAALDAERATFAARLEQFKTATATADPSFANALTAISAIPTADLDAQRFDLTALGDGTVTFAGDLASNLTALKGAIDATSKAVQALLDQAAATAASSDQVDALTAAAKALLGKDFQIYPEWTMGAAQAAEWTNALNYSASGALTQYLTATAKVDFPVDEWLYGAARVRPNMRSWEQLLMLTSAFGQPVPVLVPTQFPYEDTAPWIALPFPSDYNLVSDHLLYTAYYAKPFDSSQRQCGILLDDWTEVIPSTRKDTGLTFNFDRPNNEAPQSFLLITAASATASWQWDDLVGALNETLDLAKARAVEPVFLDATTYSQFLPATIMAATLYGISISTTLAASNGLFRTLEQPPHA